MGYVGSNELSRMWYFTFCLQLSVGIWNSKNHTFFSPAVKRSKFLESHDSSVGITTRLRTGRSGF
jgi:hypothetical protein